MKTQVLAELQRLAGGCFVKARLGPANLRGLILTKDLWDNGRQYKIEDGRREFRAPPTIRA